MTLELIDIAAALKFYQTQRGLTQQALAEKAGICPYAFGRAMKTGSLHLGTLAKLLTTLNVDLYTFSLTATAHKGAPKETDGHRPLYIPIWKRKRRGSKHRNRRNGN